MTLEQLSSKKITCTMGVGPHALVWSPADMIAVEGGENVFVFDLLRGASNASKQMNSDIITLEKDDYMSTRMVEMGCSLACLQAFPVLQYPPIFSVKQVEWCPSFVLSEDNRSPMLCVISSYGRLQIYSHSSSWNLFCDLTTFLGSPEIQRIRLHPEEEQVFSQDENCLNTGALCVSWSEISVKGSVIGACGTMGGCIVLIRGGVPFLTLQPATNSTTTTTTTTTTTSFRADAAFCVGERGVGGFRGWVSGCVWCGRTYFEGGNMYQVLVTGTVAGGVKAWKVGVGAGEGNSFVYSVELLHTLSPEDNTPIRLLSTPSPSLLPQTSTKTFICAIKGTTLHLFSFTPTHLFPPRFLHLPSPSAPLSSVPSLSLNPSVPTNSPSSSDFQKQIGGVAWMKVFPKKAPSPPPPEEFEEFEAQEHNQQHEAQEEPQEGELGLILGTLGGKVYTCCFGKEEEGHEEGEQGRCWECYETPTNAFSESFKFTVPDVSPAASSSTPSNSSLPSDSSDFPSDSSGSSEPFSDSGAAPPPSPSPSSSSAPEGGLLEISYAERSGIRGLSSSPNSFALLALTEKHADPSLPESGEQEDTKSIKTQNITAKNNYVLLSIPPPPSSPQLPDPSRSKEEFSFSFSFLTSLFENSSNETSYWDFLQRLNPSIYSVSKCLLEGAFLDYQGQEQEQEEEEEQEHSTPQKRKRAPSSSSSSPPLKRVRNEGGGRAVDREEEREGGGEALGVLQLAVCMHAHASERGFCEENKASQSFSQCSSEVIQMVMEESLQNLYFLYEKNLVSSLTPNEIETIAIVNRWCKSLPWKKGKKLFKIIESIIDVFSISTEQMDSAVSRCPYCSEVLSDECKNNFINPTCSKGHQGTRCSRSLRIIKKPRNCWKCFGCHSLSSPLPLDNYRILTLSPPSSLSSPDSPPPSLEYLWLLPSQHLSPFLSSSSSSSSPPFVPRCLLCSSRMTSLRTPLGNPPLNRPKSIIKAE